MKHPYISFYTGDWLKDPRLSLCSPATRGVWIDLLCAMHEFDRCGELCGTTDELARLARCSTVELTQALTDLQNKRAADVLQRNGNWTIANRRMQREAAIRRKRQEAGSYGGSKTQANRQQKPEYENEDDGLKRVREFARGKGICDQDADWFFWKCVGNGWTNGGRAILDWKGTLLSWWRAGYVPSKRQVPSMNGQRPKERAPSYPKLPKSREVSDAEFEKAREIARREADAFRKEQNR